MKGHKKMVETKYDKHLLIRKNCLLIINCKEEGSIAQICRKNSISYPYAFSIFKILEKEGLLVTIRESGRKSIKLTDKGEKLREHLIGLQEIFFNRGEGNGRGNNLGEERKENLL